MGGTLVSSDIVEVHYLNIVGQTVNPSANSVGSSQLTADVITGQTALAVAPDSTDELLISDGGTLKRIDVSLVGGANTPYFMVKKDSDQTINHASNTKITFDSTVFESSSNVFDLSNNKFTVATAGKYLIMSGTTLYDSNDRLERGDMYIYKNGSLIHKFTHYDKWIHQVNQQNIIWVIHL